MRFFDPSSLISLLQLVRKQSVHSITCAQIVCLKSYNHGRRFLASIFADARSALIGTGWLSHVPVEWQDALLDACRCYPAEPGRAITHGGEETGGIFAIVSGTASVYSAIGATETPLIHI